MKINSEVTQTPTGDVDTSYWTMFKNDARHSLRLASVVCAIMAITSSLVVFYLGERDYRIHHSIYETHSEKMVLFQYLVYFSLAISLPVALDMIMTFFFTESNFEEMIQPRDFSRRFMLLIITLPNIFIATELIPGTCVDIVMYYQFTLSYLVIVYRLYSLSSAQKVISFSPLRDIFLLLMLSNFAGFLYDLSLHNIIGGRMAWKIVFSVSMILSQVATLFKVAHWLKFSNRIFAAATNQQKSSKGTLYGLLLAIVMSVCMIVIYLVWYNQEVLFFPKHFESYYALEAIFCFILLIWTAVRNFEVKKSENATKVSHKN